MVSWEGRQRLVWAKIVCAWRNLSSQVKRLAELHNKFMQTPAYALSVGAAGVAYSLGGDMTLVIRALLIAWMFACIGICIANIPNEFNRTTICVLFIIPFFIEGLYVSENQSRNNISNDVADMRTQLTDFARERKLAENPAPLEPDNTKEEGGCAEFGNYYNVRVGVNDFGTSSLPFTAIAIRGEPYLVLKSSPNGGVSATFKLYDDQDRVLAEVEDNSVLIPPLGIAYMRVRHDLHSLEVADASGLVHLKIRFLNKNNISIEGVFFRHGIRFEARPTEMILPGNNTFSGSATCSTRIGMSLN